MPLAGFVSDVELNDWIREGAQELHELVVGAYGEAYVESTVALTAVAGQTDYPLPADFFKLYEVNLPIDGRQRSIRPMPRAERNYWGNATGVSGVPRYRLVGGNIRFYPAPPAGVGSIRYAPTAPALTSDSNTVDYPNGWERYIVVYAAVMAGMKEETDVRGLQALLERQRQMLVSIAEQRNLEGPQQAVDADLADAIPDWWE